MPFLIRLIHANPNSRPNLVIEFKEFWKQHCSSKMQDVPAECEVNPISSPTPPGELTKRQIELTIQKISSWCRYPNPEIYNRLCWVVSDEVIKQYNIDDLSVPNKWNYVSAVLSMKAAAAEQAVITPVNTPKVNRITKFVQPIPLQATNLNENPSKSLCEKTPKMTKVGNSGQQTPRSDLVKTAADNTSTKVLFPESEKTPKSSKTPGPMMKFLKLASNVQPKVNAVNGESNQDEVEIVFVSPKNKSAVEVKTVD